jgi:polysaccharide biosynthesis/export protein
MTTQDRSLLACRLALTLFAGWLALGGASLTAADAARPDAGSLAATHRQDVELISELTAVRVEDGGGTVRIILEANAALPVPKIRELKSPDRIVLDLANVRPRVAASTPVGAHGVDRIRVGIFSSTPLVTRVVIDLSRPLPMGIDATALESGRMALIINSQAPEPAPRPSPPPPAAPAPVAPPPEAQPTAPVPSVQAAPVPAAQAAQAPPQRPPAERPAAKPHPAPAGAARPPAVAAAAPGDYIVGPNDVLAISVWGLANLSDRYKVDADGTLSIPFVRKIVASGLSVRAVESELKQELAKTYFRNPQVAVGIDQYGSQRVFVLGEVRNPGAFPHAAGMTLGEAVVRAGTATDNASGEVLLFRVAPARSSSSDPAVPASPQPPEVVVAFLRGPRAAEDAKLPLRDRDTIYVLRAEAVHVTGEVRSPGTYSLPAAETTVLQALALAGGVTDRGSMSGVRVSRLVGGARQDFEAKLTDLVRPGDTVLVGRR